MCSGAFASKRGPSPWWAWDCSAWGWGPISSSPCRSTCDRWPEGWRSAPGWWAGDSCMDGPMWPRGAPMRGWLVSLMVLGLAGTAQADLFDTARKTVTVNSARQDTSGVTIRGGVNLTTGVQTQNTTILRGQVQTGGSCNAFDFGASIKEAFEDIPEIFATLGQELLGSLPLYVTCALDPGLCDLMKHFQALKNLTVQLKYGRCQQVQTAMAYMGSRMRGGEEGKCLEEQVNAGMP